MTGLPLSRRAADEFAGVAEHAAVPSTRLAPHVELVDELRNLGHALPGPAPAFRAALRDRLLTMSDDELSTTCEPSVDRSLDAYKAQLSPWRRRLAVSGLAAAVVTGLATGTTLASASALPGDVLYGVKRAVEDVRLALANSDAEKGRRYMEIAEARMHEIRQLVERHEGAADSALIEQISETFADMQAATARGSNLLIAAFEATHDRAVLAALLTAIEEQRAQLDAIELIAPSELQDESEIIRALLEVVTTDIVNHDPLIDEPRALPDLEPAAEETDLVDQSSLPDDAMQASQQPSEPVPTEEPDETPSTPQSTMTEPAPSGTSEEPPSPAVTSAPPGGPGSNASGPTPTTAPDSSYGTGRPDSPPADEKGRSEAGGRHAGDRRSVQDRGNAQHPAHTGTATPPVELPPPANVGDESISPA